MATESEKSTLYSVCSVFSVAATVLIPCACNRKIASLICSTLQIGILKTAPADVLTVSPFTGAEPDFWIIIPFTPVHSAVRIIAQKLRASEIWSNTKKNGFLPFSRMVSIKLSKSKNEIGEMVATAP